MFVQVTYKTEGKEDDVFEVDTISHVLLAILREYGHTMDVEVIRNITEEYISGPIH